MRWLFTVRRMAVLAGWIGLVVAGCCGPGERAKRAGAASRPVASTQAARGAERAGVAVYVGEELLYDYRPVPALVTKVTEVERPKFPVVDIHCHWNLRQDPQQMLAAMDVAGIRAAVNLSGGYGEQLDRMLEKFTRAAPQRLIIFCNLDFRQIDDPQFGPKMADWITEAQRKGARGLKIFKSLGLTVRDKSGKLVAVDDPRLDAVWERCGELGMPVLIHSGDPVAFFGPVDEKNERWMQLKRHPDWSFYGPQFPTYDEVMEQHLRMIKRHPHTTFISAHLANSGEDLQRLSQWLERCPNLYVDISGREAELGRQPYAARRFLIKYQDRVLFGTDRYPGRTDQPRYAICYRMLETEDEYFPYYDHPFPPTGEWRIYGLFLPDEVLKKIYHENADRLLGVRAVAATGAAATRAADTADIAR